MAVLTGDIRRLRCTCITGEQRIVMLTCSSSIARIRCSGSDIIDRVLSERCWHQPGSNTSIGWRENLLPISDFFSNDAQNRIHRLEEIFEIPRVGPWNSKQEIIECNRRRCFIQLDWKGLICIVSITVHVDEDFRNEIIGIQTENVRRRGWAWRERRSGGGDGW